MIAKNYLVPGVIFIILISGTIAHGRDDFAKAEEIIKQKIPCSELNEEKLEIIGDYYMEQMHPGELHEIMDERMGGEGSESLRQVHINIAKVFYCGEHESINAGMMNTMMGRNGGFGMMNYRNSNYQYNPYIALLWTFFLFIIILVILLIVILIIRSINYKKTKR